MTIKRPIRKRLWGDDKADSQSVGENMRDISASLLGLPSLRVVTFSDQVYSPDGLVWKQVSMPLGVLMILSINATGAIKTTVLTSLKFANGAATATFGLTAGERYATIRLLVIG